MTFSLDLSGFGIKKIDYNVPTNCLRSENHTLKLMLILAKKRGELAVWENYLDKCLLGMDTNFQKLFNLGSLQDKSMMEIEKTLKMMNITGAFKDNILRLAEFKYQHSELDRDFNDLHELVMSYEKALTAPQSFQLSKRIWDRVKDEAPKNNFIGKLLEVLVALRVGNDAWAKRALTEAVFVDPYQLALEINPLETNAANLSRFKEDVVKSFDIIAKEIKDEPIVQMYINTIASLTGEEIVAKKRDELGFRWSLVDIRNFIKDRIVGSSYPHVWYIALTGRTTQNEIDSYFEKALEIQKVAKWPWYKLWLFRTFFPSDEKLRHTIYELLAEMSVEPTLHQQLMLTQLAENPTIKRDLKDRVKRYTQPTFQLKREFYRQLFYSGTAPYFALFQLWSMGDINDEGLVWFAI